MKKFTVLFLSLILLAACGTAEEQQGTSEEQQTSEQGSTFAAECTNVQDKALRQLESDNGCPTVEMVTSMGTITIELYPDIAPKAVENFMTHSKNGYYDGLTFHRVMNEFMIQGGDPLGTGTGGESIYGESFEDEFSDKVMHLRGALSMANSGPNSNGSQFFIVQKTGIEAELLAQMKDAKFPEDLSKAYEENGGTPWLDNRHTVFGQVIEGLDVVDAIAAVEVDAQSSKPLETVTIESINVKE
ncbi:peptidylprolyl isomerase [Bacillus pinisoli]|uniref:peptidylprolyl isomerase n=1 Tax=Bacillus pinisoli TaxID=2901866 RepID=UPI001FF24C2D|nr:peptidylprolyl isomerase [Bacillus pinisoli]